LFDEFLYEASVPVAIREIYMHKPKYYGVCAYGSAMYAYYTHVLAES
jgi:hypothetical protein